ncbi:hypothetical protein SAMN05216464_10294 [Mucilaginibacter pineti]|uniref:Glycosyl transferase family 2 n=1 Tax=Mucilaginibacter pineti TaxID=1391627 RepID=A0A1G6W8F3_9SPHI|nr:hypothetical protein [Mucilaginibacter pineti]SDD62142.1 hypothetical protein SAMN05216464_10294 [Mucilaginibacter pineti]
MKIAVHVLAYNVNRFLSVVLKSIEPHVDKIYVVHSQRPWQYVESSRLSKTNPTTISDIVTAAAGSDKVEIIQGDWLTEEDMRNECLEKARAEGFDWFLIEDADEFYLDSTWEQIKRELSTNTTDDLLITTWYNFWKSSHYVLVNEDGSIKGTNAGFAIRCASKAKFTNKRLCDAQSVKVIDCPCYHYGYVMSDVEMEEKISTWGHATDFNPVDWFKYKWVYWNKSTKFLHPTVPGSWNNAIRFPLEQPYFGAYFALPVSTSEVPGFSSWLKMETYDVKIKAKRFAKSVKKVLKSLSK